MKISNKTYDFLKWFALIAIPALNVFILTVGKIWELPYYVQIAATISAVGVLIAALIGVTSRNYWDDVDEEDDNEAEMLDDIEVE